MNNKFSLAIIGVNLLIVIGVVNYLIFSQKAVIKHGKTVFLSLAPVDPRSLMQGDYMILRQQLSSSLPNRHDRSNAIPTRGRIILELDEKNIGSFVRFESNKTANLNENQVFLKYRISNRGYLFGLESFFFEEGMGKVYEDAEFCEVKVDQQGRAVLIDLRGKDLSVLANDSR